MIRACLAGRQTPSAGDLFAGKAVAERERGPSTFAAPLRQPKLGATRVYFPTAVDPRSGLV